MVFDEIMDEIIADYMKISWTRRSFILGVVGLLVIGLVGYYYWRSRASADVVGVAPQITGLADSYIARYQSGSATASIEYSVNDSDADSLAIPSDMINWGDGNTDYLNFYSNPRDVTRYKASGYSGDAAFAVRRRHTYRTPGSYNVHITTYDSKGNLAERSTNIIVTSEADTGSVNYAPSITLTQKPDLTLNNYQIMVVAQTDDYSELGSTRTITADWGDGTSLETIPVVWSADRAASTVLQHSYAYIGNVEHRATFRVTDASGASNTVSHMILARNDYQPKLLVDQTNSQLISTGGSVLQTHVVATSEKGADLTATQSLISSDGSVISTQPVTPKTSTILGDYYDYSSGVYVQNVRLVEYDLRLPVPSTESFSNWKLEVSDMNGKTTSAVMPVTILGAGDREIQDNFDTILSRNGMYAQCADYDTRGWQVGGKESRGVITNDANPNWYDQIGETRFQEYNCRLYFSAIRSAGRSTLNRSFTANYKYEFGQGGSNDTRLVTEFDLSDVYAEYQSVAYIGLADYGDLTALPAVGIKLSGQSEGYDTQVALYQVNAQGEPQADTEFTTLSPNKKYRVSVVVDHQTRLLVRIREYGAQTSPVWSELQLAAKQSVNSLRLSDDGTLDVPGRSSSLVYRLDNLSVVGRGRVATSTPTVTTPTVTTPTVTTPQATDRPVPLEQQVSTRSQMITTAEQHAITRSIGANQQLVDYRSQLEAARLNYVAAVKSGSRSEIAKTKAILLKAYRQVVIAQRKARVYVERLRLVNYSKQRISGLESANVAKQQELSRVQASLSTARATYAQKRTWSNYYHVRRLATRVTALNWRINYNLRLVKFHENRLQTEAAE